MATPDPSERQAAFLHARKLHEEGRRAEAAAACEEQMARWPEFAPPFHLRGFIALEKGELALAESWVRQALQRDPGDAAAQYTLGLILRAGRRFPEAIAALQRALGIDSRNVPAMNSLALCLLDANRPGEALDVLLIAAKTDPGHAETHHHMGLVLSRQGKPDEAQASFRRAMALKPELTPPLYACAKSLLESGGAEEAQSLFRECLRRRPDWNEAKAGLALALELLGRADEAEVLLRSGAGSDVMLAINLGNLVARERRLEEGLHVFDRVLAHSPDNAVAQHNRANVLARMDRGEEAEEGFRKAIALQPRYSDPHFGLALVLLARGEYEEGWREFSWRPPATPTWLGRAVLSRSTDPAVVKRVNAERAVEVIEEQGIGDMLFFLRWARALAAEGWSITLRCAPRLAGLVGRTGLFKIRDVLAAPVGIDCAAIPAGDLPLLALELGLGSTPRSLELSPLSDCVEAARQALDGAGPGPYLGVTWRAGLRQRALGRDNLTKEIEPGLLLDNLRWGGTVIALQRDATAPEVSGLRARGFRVADFSSWGDDLDELLGLLDSLDDYAGVSNTNVHLMAALERRARIAVPSPTEWRWAPSQAPTWFPRFSVVRQRYGEAWRDALPAPGKWQYPGET